MNLFKKNELNEFNLGDKFLMEIELVEIENYRGNIVYSVIPTYKADCSKIYSITKNELTKMKVSNQNENQ